MFTSASNCLNFSKSGTSGGSVSRKEIEFSQAVVEHNDRSHGYFLFAFVIAVRFLMQRTPDIQMLVVFAEQNFTFGLAEYLKDTGLLPISQRSASLPSCSAVIEGVFSLNTDTIRFLRANKPFIHFGPGSAKVSAIAQPSIRLFLKVSRNMEKVVAGIEQMESFICQTVFYLIWNNEKDYKPPFKKDKTKHYLTHLCFDLGQVTTVSDILLRSGFIELRTLNYNRNIR